MKKINRPMIGNSPVHRYNISLPPEIAKRLRRLGNGNLSAGIRMALTLQIRSDELEQQLAKAKETICELEGDQHE